MYTHFGLEMIYSFDRGSVDIDVSPDYYDKLCGMCGTCNFDSSDDFTLPSQELVRKMFCFILGMQKIVALIN